MPDFVDIDQDTYNMSMDELAGKLEKAARKGRIPKAVVPVHFAGQSCEMERLYDLKKKYGFTVIEDACHAIGGGYKGNRVGSCEFSDMTVFSFHPVKIITTGEGGMIVTNNEELYRKLLLLRTHGITRDPELMEGGSEGPWYYQQIDLGLNYRITDIQASLGLSQLKRLDEFVSMRNRLARRYNEALSALPLRLPIVHPDAYSSFHLYIIRLRLDEMRRTRNEIFEMLRERGIGVNVHYIPVHTQPYYRRLGFSPGDFPQAERYYQEAISLPLYPSMTVKEQDKVITSLNELLI
jgi:dTDP-4-amino-4,6-dideoxygalactose transaminase